MRKQQLANSGIPVITNAGRNYSSPTSAAGGNLGKLLCLCNDQNVLDGRSFTWNMVITFLLIHTLPFLFTAASRSFFPDDTNNHNMTNNGNGTTPRAVPVHVRLYQEAVEKATEHHNAQVD